MQSLLVSAEENIELTHVCYYTYYLFIVIYSQLIFWRAAMKERGYVEVSIWLAGWWAGVWLICVTFCEVNFYRRL